MRVLGFGFLVRWLRDKWLYCRDLGVYVAELLRGCGSGTGSGNCYEIRHDLAFLPDRYIADSLTRIPLSTSHPQRRATLSPRVRVMKI